MKDEEESTTTTAAALSSLCLLCVSYYSQVSPMVARSLQILWNSPAGMVTLALYSVSGMARCSPSMSISLSSKVALSPLSLESAPVAGSLKAMVTLSPSSCAESVTASFDWLHLRILLRFCRERPKNRFLSQRYSSNISLPIFREIKLTWLLSMAWSLRPSSLHSRLASLTNSFIASTSFFSRWPWERRASNLQAKRSDDGGKGIKREEYEGRATRGNEGEKDRVKEGGFKA